MAPEILIEGVTYDNKVDTWALGVLAYIMLCAQYPFIGKNKERIKKAIKTKEPDFSPLSVYSQAPLI